MAKTLSYINTSPRGHNPQDDTADLQRQTRELGRELSTVKKSYMAATERIGALKKENEALRKSLKELQSYLDVLHEKVEPGNVVIV